MVFKMYISNPEVIEDARAAIKNEEMKPGMYNLNFPRYMKCCLGKLDIEAIRNEQMRLKTKSPNHKSIVLVMVDCFIENIEVVTFENSNYKNQDVNKLGLDSYQGDCLFLTYSQERTTNMHDMSLIFAVKNPIYVDYLSLIEFTPFERSRVCSNSDHVPSENTKFSFCQNCNLNFCEDCWLKTHQNDNDGFKGHVQTDEHFTAFNSLFCNTHVTKKNEFYCLTCNSVYCVMCLTHGFHKEYKDHDIKFVDDAFENLQDEVSALDRRIKEFDKFVTSNLNSLLKEAENIKDGMENRKKDLDSEKNKIMKDVNNEAASKMKYVASLQAEVFRLSQDLENKLNFMRQQFYSADIASYIYFRNIFDDWVKNDLEPMFSILSSIDLTFVTEPILKKDE
jgi:hypothetical protein